MKIKGTIAHADLEKTRLKPWSSAANKDVQKHAANRKQINITEKSYIYV